MPKLILLCLIVFLSVSSKAQNLVYSAAVGNYPYAHAQIIGSVKNNIIIYHQNWSPPFDVRNSEILVYDDDMHLLKTTSFSSIVPKLCSVDFSKQGDSFSAIVQFVENGNFVCKLVSFDANGNILGTQILEHSADIGAGKYELIRSSKGESFALLRIALAEMNGAIALQYHFVKNGSLVRSDKILIPFDTLSSGLGRVLLDDDNLILPVNDTANGEKLTLFKIDLTNNSSINTIRNLGHGHLILPGLRINENNQYYMVTSQWKTGAESADADPRIFLWQLNKDLTDISADTVISNIDSSNPCLQNLYHYQLNSIAFNDRTSNLIISAGYVTSGNGNYFSRPGSYTGSTYNSSPYQGVSSPPAGSFYEGRVTSFMPIKEFNGNSSDTWANVVHGPTWSNYTGGSGNSANYGLLPGKIKAQPPTLAILNIDSQNNLNWTQCFSDGLEENFKSLVNESAFLNTKNALHIIYLKSVPKKKQALGEIVLHPDGQYEMKPVIAMNIKYKYLLPESLQISERELIIPCTINDKLAFAKLTID